MDVNGEGVVVRRFPDPGFEELAEHGVDVFLVVFVFSEAIIGISSVDLDPFSLELGDLDLLDLGFVHERLGDDGVVGERVSADVGR